MILARIFSVPREPDLVSWACLVLAVCVLHRDPDPLTLSIWLALCTSGLHGSPGLVAHIMCVGCGW